MGANEKSAHYEVIEKLETRSHAAATHNKPSGAITPSRQRSDIAGIRKSPGVTWNRLHAWEWRWFASGVCTIEQHGRRLGGARERKARVHARKVRAPNWVAVSFYMCHYGTRLRDDSVQIVDQ